MRKPLNVVLGVFLSASALRKKSDNLPGQIVICTNTSKVALDGVVVECGSKAGRLFVALLALRGSVLEFDDAWFFLWGDREDGGPDTASTTMKVMVHRLQIGAAAIGYRIENVHGRGWRAVPAISTPVIQAAE